MGSLFHKALPAAGSNRLLELSKLSEWVCVCVCAFAGTSGPEPGQVPTQILLPFKRSPTYSHSCLEGFYKWYPQTPVLGSCFKMCASLIQPSLSRVISSGSGKILSLKRYCFFWEALLHPSSLQVCPQLGLFHLIHADLNISWDEVESGWFWDEEVLLLQVVKPTGHTAWPLHLSTELEVLPSCLTEQVAGITSSKMPSLSGKLLHLLVGRSSVVPPLLLFLLFLCLDLDLKWLLLALLLCYLAHIKDSDINLASASSLRGCWKHPIFPSGTRCWAFVAKYWTRNKSGTKWDSNRYNIIFQGDSI